MNSTYELLCQRANGQAKHLEHNNRLLSADLPEAGPYWEYLATTHYLPRQEWACVACAYELAGDAWMHVGQRELAAQNYDQAAVYYESANCEPKAREMHAMANDVRQMPYF
jgi:hypothetical protein